MFFFAQGTGDVLGVSDVGGVTVPHNNGADGI